MEAIDSLFSGNFIVYSESGPSSATDRVLIQSHERLPTTLSGKINSARLQTSVSTVSAKMTDNSGSCSTSAEKILKVPRCAYNPEPEVKFSINRILNLPTSSRAVVPKVTQESATVVQTSSGDTSRQQEDHQYSWLNCTRYKPPKLQRIKKKEGGKKRKLGRNPRVPFTQSQVSALEQKFARTHYLSSMDVAELSSRLELTENRVKIWFQNRRARERRDREGRPRVSSRAQGLPAQPPATLQNPSGSLPTHSGLSQFYMTFHSLGTNSAFTPVPLQSFTRP